MIQVRETNKMIRMIIASANPKVRALGCLCSGSLPTRMEMKTMLSIPRTISSPVRVASAIQTCGSVIQPIGPYLLIISNLRGKVAP